MFDKAFGRASRIARYRQSFWDCALRLLSAFGVYGHRHPCCFESVLLNYTGRLFVLVKKSMVGKVFSGALGAKYT